MTPALIRHLPRRLPHRATGFTLIEAIVTIAILGILGAIIAVFIGKPIQGYFDSARRAELTDQADVALRRITRDLRLALPNSVRVSLNPGGVNYIEFILTSNGGRYRDEADGSTGGDFLSYTNPADVSFDVLGTMPANPAIVAGDFIVIYNLGAGNAPADAYTGGNRAQVQGVAGNVITLATNPFALQAPPLPSPDARFQVVPGVPGGPTGTQAVTYACPDAAAAPANLTRQWNYGFNAAQATPPAGGTIAPLAGNATCTVQYAANASGRNGLLLINLTLTDASGERITLAQQIRIDNTP
ncbi:type II secretion system protein [Rugosibacter aromaticivorans]|uniref:type II secretion system protein n=1 Tax=Rugosibacter aromaticivorans TaxID=1565605 RepID=UPI000AE770D5|nr:type II secretion system protein [Rugosibacter aromaticivorans]TBR15563.1 MAG: type II secretion system protein [Rugosibacter sp.]